LILMKIAHFQCHANAIVETANVGQRTRVWAFAHLLPGARIGEDCNICDNVFIENDVVVGDRVTIKCGVQLWDGVRVEDDVFIGPNATFTNDNFPRSRRRPEKFEETRICRGASIGGNATILPGVVVGEFAMIGAGAVVTKSIPPYAIVVGNPARIIGYVGSEKAALKPAISLRAQGNDYRRIESNVHGVTLHQFPEHGDIRGNLTVGNFGDQIPFEAKRYFLVHKVPSAETRGAHAHRVCHQFLVCVTGSVSVVADDGTVREEFKLDRPNVGLYLPPMIWGIQYKYTADAILLVFASHLYDSEDYIRSYDEFVKMRRSK